MIWTRRPLTQTSGWFNQKPLAPLDETLRFPLALEEILRLLKGEYGISLKKKPLVVHHGYFYFRSYKDYFLQIIFQPKVYLISWRVIRETKRAKDKWEGQLQRFLKEFSQLKRQDLAKLNNQELLEQIKKKIRFDAYWLFRLGFGLPLIYHYLSEIFLKLLYHLLVRDEYPQNYHELVAGYSSKLKEADLAFWQVVEGKLSQEIYLEEYGYRATDVSLAIPTIGEDKNALKGQIESFRRFSLPDFEKKYREVLARRKFREKFMAENFRSWVPFGKSIFNKTLEIARRYITIRETRRFYYTQPTFLIRKSLLKLGSRFKFLQKPEDIFFLSKSELEKAVLDPKEIDKQKIQTEISQRKKQWNEWSKQTPPEEIEK